MTEHELIRHMKRFPDKILKGNLLKLKSKKWKCSKCLKIFRFEDETPISVCAPCECGSIFFEVVKEEK